MPNTLTHRERLLRSARGESVDRVPIDPPITFDPIWWEAQGADVVPEADPLYAEVAAMCAEHCDVFVGMPAIGPLFDRRFLLTPSEHIERLEPVREGEWTVIRHIVHTPKGDLTTTDKVQDGVQTGWYTEPLVKTPADAEALLSVPYEFTPVELAPARARVEACGDRTVAHLTVSTPLVSVSRLMHFDQLLLWCYTERELLHRLIDTMTERIELGLRYVIDEGLAEMMWLGGSEQATPPMMGPGMYDEFVTQYDGRIIDMMHAGGGLVHVHCHGKVGGILDRLLDMGVDMLDPVEPPPDGDITMAEAKKQCAGRMTLMGNIEFHELEFASPKRIRELVKAAILDGGPERTYLFPSATPIEAITPRYRDNALAYIEAGLEFGALS